MSLAFDITGVGWWESGWGRKKALINALTSDYLSSGRKMWMMMIDLIPKRNSFRTPFVHEDTAMYMSESQISPKQPQRTICTICTRLVRKLHNLSDTWWFRRSASVDLPPYRKSFPILKKWKFKILKIRLSWSSRIFWRLSMTEEIKYLLLKVMNFINLSHLIRF